MFNRLFSSGLAALATIPLALGEVAAWPERTVKFVTPGAAGTHTDAIARLIADALSRKWGQPVVVENQPGADGILAVRSFVGAKDGHTLLYSFNSIITVNPALHENLPYDPLRDLVPIARVVDDFIAIVASPQSGIATLGALEQAMRARPNELSYASFPGSPYVVFQIFQKQVGADLTFVPYRAMSGALTDLMQNRIQIGVLSLALVRELARSGKLNVLALASRERAPAEPTIPTAAELGRGELLVLGGHGIYAHDAMPAPLRDRIAQDVLEALADPALAARIAELGFILRPQAPTAYRAFLASETQRMQALIHGLGARVHAPSAR
jgi:tripartite-type tricarboxylate transporter receptor subunit TctC